MSAETRDAEILLISISVFILKILLDTFIRNFKYTAYLNESGMTIIMGIIFGLISYGFQKALAFEKFVVNPETYSEVFSVILLPPIIFHAGFTMKKRFFFRNFWGILCLALIGSFVSCIAIGGLLWVGGQQAHFISGVSSDPVESLLFGALMAATDPVATLSVLQELNVNPVVFSLIFGESVLNDSIAIVLYRTFVSFIRKDLFRLSSFRDIVTRFIILNVGSIGVGLGVAVASGVLMKRLGKYLETHEELVFIFFFGYASYFISEMAGLSGILSVFICATMMGHYHFYSLKIETRKTIHDISHTVAYVSESLVFLSIGVAIFHTSDKASDWKPTFIFWSLFLLLVTRALHVFPLCTLFNLRRRGEQRIEFKDMFMIWFAGLRGAVALILAFSLPDAIETKGLLINTTLVIVLFTNLIQGPFTKPLIKYLGVRLEQASDRASITSFTEQSLTSPRPPAVKRGRFHSLWVWIDEKVIKPWLGGRIRSDPKDQSDDDDNVCPEENPLMAEVSEGSFISSPRFDNDEL